jgi:hypothetical protein
LPDPLSIRAAIAVAEIENAVEGADHYAIAGLGKRPLSQPHDCFLERRLCAP